MTEEMEPTTEELREECLCRWLAATPKRRAVALQIMAGERDWNPKWEQWMVYDIQQEIVAIETARNRIWAEAERLKKERAAKEAQKDFLL
jgi:hypothetical protein